jgi:hypothetical protein
MGMTPHLHIIGMLLLKVIPPIMKHLDYSMKQQMSIEPWLTP